MAPEATEEQKRDVAEILKKGGFDIHKSDGAEYTVFGAIGSFSGFDIRNIKILPGVENVIRVSTPYKLAGRHFHKEDTVINFPGDISIGSKKIIVMAGPCSVESEEQIETSAMIVKSMGGKILRGGAFKPRSSPYSFQGLGLEGLKLMRKAADNNGLLVISEILDKDHIKEFMEYVDIIQVGARNMQNFQLLKELGKADKPVMIKRGLSSTIEEWLMSAEYVMAGGNHNVILCERGIRTFEVFTRNTLDISAVPVVKELCHLPVVVDPSHAIGIRNKVIPLARAAVAAEADGLIVEVHPDPQKALSDGAQSLYPDQFDKMMKEIRNIAAAIGREV